MKEFVHLHNHTEYSLLDGFARVKQLVKRAKAEGARAIAITDHGNVYGTIKFYDACLEAGIKPILGMEAYVADDHTIPDNKRYHLILLAKNYNGFLNIMKMSSISFKEGLSYGKPRIDFKLLKEYHEDIICLSACLAGEVPQLLLDNRYEEAKDLAKKYKELFGEDYYIELQNHGIREEQLVLPLLKKIASELDIKTVATNDIHYIDKEDADAHDILLCIQTGAFYDDKDRMRFDGQEYYYKNYDQMLEAIGDEEALDRTLEIADKCDIHIKYNEYVVPSYDPKYSNFNGTPEEFLRYMTYEGLKFRYGEITPEIKERADFELGVIERMGYVSYFLIVWEYINYAKKNDIPVGPGRGSGAGSIVAYAIRITEIDPIRYGLLFERFLNPDRKSMPDIDVDFCSDGREQVIQHVRDFYHEENVCQIITFGTMKKKNAIKNVARVLRIPFAESNELAKNIRNNDAKVHITNLIDPKDPAYVKELGEMYENNPTYKKIIDYAIKLEDMPKDRGKHAAGVIICSVPITDKIAIAKNGDDIITQFDKDECEKLGLLKMDFLALKTLTDIHMACKLVKRFKGVDIDFEKCTYDDPKVFGMLGEGETDTVFQLEGGGMKDFMRRLKPSSMEEIIAGVSLFRPGPMDYIPEYIKNKFNQESIDYGLPILEPILKSTYGIVVYQEQAMQITRAMANYSMGESDNYRKLISKKKLSQHPEEMPKFLSRCQENGISLEFAQAMWDKLEKFGSYAFNKSHAAAYSYVTYQTAFLKYYYPVEYIASVINNRITNPDDTSKYLLLLKQMNIELLKPDINKSEGLFIPENGGIRYGLACIQNVGLGAMELMVEERNKNGPFKDLTDFAERVDQTVLNKRLIEGLIKAGAFDDFGQNRATLMANYEQVIQDALVRKKATNSDQMCFDFLLEAEDFNYIQVPEYNKMAKLKFEKEVCGRYITGHPLEDYEEEFKKFKFNTSQLLPIENDEMSEYDEEEVKYNVENDQVVDFCGLLSDVTIKLSKNNKKYGSAHIEDFYGMAELVFFGNTIDKYKDLLKDDTLVRVRGTIRLGEDSPKPVISLNSLAPWGLEEKNAQIDNRQLCMRITEKEQFFLVKDAIKNNIDTYGADVLIQFDQKLYTLQEKVLDPDGLKTKLIGLVGYNNVKIRPKK